MMDLALTLVSHGMLTCFRVDKIAIRGKRLEDMIERNSTVIGKVSLD